MGIPSGRTGLGVDLEAVEVVELPAEVDVVDLPHVLERPDFFGQPRAAVLEVVAQHLELLLHPADADRDVEPTARQDVDAYE